MFVLVWLICAVGLATTLAWAAIAKLRSPLATDRGFRELRVHPLLSRPWMRRSLPWIELALAVGMLASWGIVAIIVAICVFLLMATYLFLIARAVTRPDDVVCNCFGGRKQRPIDGWTVTRNIAFTLAAALALESVLLDPWSRAAAWPVLLVEWLGVMTG